MLFFACKIVYFEDIYFTDSIEKEVVVKMFLDFAQLLITSST